MSATAAGTTNPIWGRNIERVPPLVEVTPDHSLQFNFHKGQARAWFAEERIVAIVAGTQSGKTTFGPLWLHREIQRCGPGTYLIAAPTDPLLQVKLIPAFKQLFVEQLQLGEYTGSPRPQFVLSKEGERRLWGREQDEPTVVYFGYAAKPDSLESMTVKAAWLDEAGQAEFKTGSWEAILRRLSLSQGRILITTTPYTVGHWLKRRVFDKRFDPRESIKVVQFKSIWNPAFPRAEWERAKRDLAPWKFRMMYCGDFARPAGQIYDVFSETVHVVPRFAIPATWKRYGGLDFGGVNTAATYIAEEPVTQNLYVYRYYKGGNRTAAQHRVQLLLGEPKVPAFWGGAKSEQQWRDEFKAAGLKVSQPLVSEVEIGIDRVYAELSNRGLFVFDDLDEVIDEFLNYSRVTDDEGNVHEAIADKNEFHALDSLRYVVGSVRGGRRGSGYHVTEPAGYDDDERNARLDNYYGR